MIWSCLRAGDRPTDDHHEAHDQHDLEHVHAKLDEHGKHAGRGGAGHGIVDERQQLVATKEEQHPERLLVTQVLRIQREEQGETHRGILGVVATHEFLLGFGVVERGAVAFCEDGKEEDEAREGLAQDEPAVLLLIADHFDGHGGAHHEQRGHERQAQRNFIRDHLCAWRENP